MSKIAIRDSNIVMLFIDGKIWRQIGIVIIDDLDNSQEDPREVNKRLAACWKACQGLPMNELEYLAKRNPANQGSPEGL